MDKHPCQPCQHAFEMKAVEIGHGKVAAYGGHGAFVFICKFAVPGVGIELTGEQPGLLDGGLGKLRMSLGGIWESPSWLCRQRQTHRRGR